MELSTSGILYLERLRILTGSPSNKTPALTESMNMNIWVIGTSKQVFIRDS